jgi:ATP-binding cassette subfamily B protein
MPAEPASNAALRFRDVLKFIVPYWRGQPVKLATIIVMLISAAALEANLPNMLESLLRAIREQHSNSEVLLKLCWFISNYLAVTTLNGTLLLIFNVFETRVFRSILNDAYEHVQRLSERFFINTFAGSIISKISRGRSQIETFEDQLFLNILPIVVVLLCSVAFLAVRFEVLAIILALYVIVLIAVSWVLVTRLAGPAQAKANEGSDRFNANLADGIAGISTSKSFAQENYEITRMRKVITHFTLMGMRSYLAQNIASLVQRLMLAGMLAVLLGGRCLVPVPWPRFARKHRLPGAGLDYPAKLRQQLR